MKVGVNLCFSRETFFFLMRSVKEQTFTINQFWYELNHLHGNIFYRHLMLASWKRCNLQYLHFKVQQKNEIRFQKMNFNNSLHSDPVSYFIFFIA